MPELYQKGLISLHQESEAENLLIQGQFPDWLTGILLRNGPGCFKLAGEAYRHFFDGLAMLHRFSFNSGRVQHSGKYLRSRAFLQDTTSGRVNFRGFATDPLAPDNSENFGNSRFALTDNAPINVVKISGSYLALSETASPVEFQSDSLATIGPWGEGEKDFPTLLTISAHPHYDFARKSFFNFGLQLGINNSFQYQIYSIEAGSRHRRLLCSLPVREPAYMHSFAMTPNYLILIEFPLLLTEPLRMASGSQPFIRSFDWKPSQATRFNVFSKRSGKLIDIFEGPTCFAYHQANAFEIEGGVVVDLAAYPDPAIIDLFYMDKLSEPGHPSLPACRLLRFRHRLHRDDADYEVLYQNHLELPRINYEQHGGKAYRFVYAVSRGLTPAPFEDRLLKLDLRAGSTQIWSEEGCFPGEPVFVAGASPDGEDTGLVLSLVLDTRQDRSFLLALDASSWQELGRAWLPCPVPFGLHGNYYAA